MNFEHELNGWELLYRNGKRGKYPNEMLIRFINEKFELDNRQDKNILDLGYGTGRHLLYLAEQGFNTYGVEFSASGCEVATKWLEKENLTATIKNQTGLNYDFGDVKFDAIIDIASLECNRYDDMKAIINRSFEYIKPGGYFFSYQKSSDDSSFMDGVKINENTRKYSSIVSKVDTATIITFTSIDEALWLFNSYDNVIINKEEWTYDNLNKKVSHWVVVAQKL